MLPKSVMEHSNLQACTAQKAIEEWLTRIQEVGLLSSRSMLKNDLSGWFFSALFALTVGRSGRFGFERGLGI